MWSKDLDEWLEENSVEGGHNSNGFMVAFIGFFIKLGIHIVTFGVTFILSILWKRYRGPKKYYSQYIYSRNNKFQNIDEVEYGINKVLKKVGLDLSKNEKALFFIKDYDKGGHGIILTNHRLISNLFTPTGNLFKEISHLSKLVASGDFGEIAEQGARGKVMKNDIPLDELQNVEWHADSNLLNEGIENFVLSSDKHLLGQVMNPNPKLYEDFMNAVTDAINNDMKFV